MVMPFTMIHGGDMNERIKELSIKAGFPEWSNHAIEFELEKFAELIVQECAKMVDDDGDAVMALRILNRFGVDN